MISYVEKKRVKVNKVKISALRGHRTHSSHNTVEFVPN